MLFDEKQLDILPSDVDKLSSIRTMMYKRSSYGAGAAYDKGALIQLQSMYYKEATKAKFQREQYDNAFESISKKGGLNEAAIFGDRLIVQDKNGDITYVGVRDYLENPNKYSVLTYSNLMYLRANDPSYAGDSQIINIVSSGTGTVDVNKQIEDLAGNIGTETIKSENYISKQQQKVIKGLQELENSSELINQQGLTLDGVYKITSLTKSQKDNINTAISYIYKQLTPEAQVLLQYKGGNKDNPVEGALELIFSKLVSNSSSSQEFSIDYQTDLNPDGSKKSSNNKDSDKYKGIEENTALAFLRGRGERSVVNIIPGNNTGSSIVANTMILSKSDNKPFDGKYLDEIASSGYAGILDLTNATMGNGIKIFNPREVEITDPHIRKILFPALPDGSPDFSEITLEKKKEADNKLLQMGIDVNDIDSYQKNEQIINQVYAEAGAANGNNLRYFAVLDGRTNNNALGIDMFTNNPYLEEVSDRETQDYLKTYSDYYSKGNKKSKIDFDEFQWYNPADWFGAYDAVYKGLIWIPIINSYALANAGTGEKLKSSEANIEDAREFATQRENEARRNYISPEMFE